MVQRLVLKNEVVKVRGHVKIIKVKKEEFDKFLKLTKLKILDKGYEALMPPLDSLQKNTIDINGLSILIQQFLTAMILNSGNTNATSPAQMVLTTSGGTVTLSYTSNIGINSQGVTVFIQILEENSNYTFQYFYVGFDTTNSSYTVSQLELYVSAEASPFYTNLVRIAYTSNSFTKSSGCYLFIVWLIEFQNIPPYLVGFTPILQNNVGIVPYTITSSPPSVPTYYNVYFNNNNCNFACNGNCPSTNISGFITYVQNNSVVLELPTTAPLNAGITNVQVLLCTGTGFQNLPAISGYTTATLTPPVSGATFYVAITTITITYIGS